MEQRPVGQAGQAVPESHVAQLGGEDVALVQGDPKLAEQPGVLRERGELAYHDQSGTGHHADQYRPGAPVQAVAEQRDDQQGEARAQGEVRQRAVRPARATA